MLTTLKSGKDIEEAILNYNAIGRASPRQKFRQKVTRVMV